MASKKDVHVVPKHGDWTVKREGNPDPLSIHDKKSDAQEKARDIGRRDKVDVVIHDRKGRIQDSDSYGNDPHPPKDKKH